MNRTNPWKPTWFEKQILTIKQEENKGEQPTGKRKKTSDPKPQQKAEVSTIHYSHTQNATKILSDAASTEDSKRIDRMEQRVASLQESNVDL
jgi:hypothetical protein